MDGLLNIYKEKGFTSHDVVAKLRGILKMKKIGHTGTLDPDAQGVLPVCIGKATKVCDLITDKVKTYETTLLLGKETDTQDITGTVLAEKKVTVTEEELQEVIAGFVGETEQIPPMYSACKVNGKRLYELARAGEVVERKPRRITIHEIEILKMELPRVKLRITCSKGTYIRTICHDIGKKCGCGGCMEELLRTKVGIFTLENAKKLSEIEEIVKKNELAGVLQQVDTLFMKYPGATVKKEYEKWLYNGNPLKTEWFCEEGNDFFGKLRIYDEEENFIGIYEYRSERKLYFPLKMFR